MAQLAAPRAGLEGFGGFEGSIRQFRASRKGQTWPATAHSLATPRDNLAGFGTFEGFQGSTAHSLEIQETVWQVSERLKSLKGASGSFGPVEQERLGVSQLAAPRASLEGFGGFEAFEGFEGSIRQFRAREKERRGLPHAAHSLATPSDGLAGFGRFGRFGRFEGSIRQLRARKK